MVSGLYLQCGDYWTVFTKKKKQIATIIEDQISLKMKTEKLFSRMKQILLPNILNPTRKNITYRSICSIVLSKVYHALQPPEKLK
jgi:hypothetical protein